MSQPFSVAGEVSLDLTGGTAYGTQALVMLADGNYGLYAGDANSDGSIFNDDLIGEWLPQAGQAGYLGADFDLDGSAFNDDLIGFWLRNAGKGSQVPPH